jgi:hypothetical protein
MLARPSKQRPRSQKDQEREEEQERKDSLATKDGLGYDRSSHATDLTHGIFPR